MCLSVSLTATHLIQSFTWLDNCAFILSVLIFGFKPVVYDVRESVGSVDLGIFFMSGNAGEFVPHLNASTIDGTVIGKYVTNLYHGT